MVTPNFETVLAITFETLSTQVTLQEWVEAIFFRDGYLPVVYFRQIFELYVIRQFGTAIEEKFSNAKVFESDASLLLMEDGVKRSLKELQEKNPIMHIVVNELTESEKFSKVDDSVLFDSDLKTTMS